MLFHPSDLRLGRFADRDLRPRSTRRVARHLQRCGRCRARVNATRSLSHDAKALPIPALPAGLKDRILRALEVGEPVIVPVADPLRPARPWRRVAWVGIGVLVIIGGVRLMFNTPLYSEASVLKFTPATPSPGEEITVTYHASSRLDSESTLRLRAVYRRAGDRDARWGTPHVSTMSLERASDRTYTARVQLPADVVYARFAVEDAAGEVVDHGGSMGWELLVYANGRPTYEALHQQFDEAFGYDNGEALEKAREATRDYPNRVEAWQSLSAVERLVYGSDAFDRLGLVHIPRIHALDSLLSQGPVSEDDLREMQMYAFVWDVKDVEQRWHQRLLSEAPRSRGGVQLRTVDIVMEKGTPPRERLRQLDSLYDDVGAVHALLLPYEAFTLADSMGDPGASLRWARRLIAIEPWRRTSMATQLLSFPTLRDTALAWIDSEIVQVDGRDDRSRPLFMTRSRYRRFVDSTRFDLLGLKGQALLAMGDTSEAHACLDSAVARGWDVGRFRDAAAARLAANDTLGAAQLLARVAVDPGSYDEDATRLGSRLLGGPAWEREEDRARADMLRETQRQAEPRSLFDSVRVTLRTGATVDLREMLRGHVTVVSFWYPCDSRACIGRLTRLDTLVARLPGAPRLTIVSRRALDRADWDRLDKAGVASLVTVDGKGDAAQAFGVWGTSGTFVADASGVIRYQNVSLDDVARCVMVLHLMENVATAESRPDPRGETAEQR